MKIDTYANKLNELLGITEKVEEVKKTVAAKKGKIIGVTEEEIDTYRAREGIVYFLQAPELFHPRTCKQCEAPFLVSRLHVSCCSYECIARWCEVNYGVTWSRKDDLELMVKEVYEGNEPLWVTNLPMLQKALKKITEALTPSSETVSNEESLQTPMKSSLPDTIGNSTLNYPPPPSPIPFSKIPPPKL